MKIIKKYYRKLKAFKMAFVEFKKLTKKSKVTKDNTAKSLVIELSDPSIYNRYFYNFIKFFDLCGYTIYWPDFTLTNYRKKYFNRNQHHSNYFNLIFQENLISFKKAPDHADEKIVLTDSTLSADYFYLKRNNDVSDSKKLYFVPMSMHPLFYHKGYWNNLEPNVKKRKKTIIFAGNFRKEDYNQFDQKLFQMSNRLETRDFLLKNIYYNEINTKSELDDFIKIKDDDSKVLILDAQKVTIPNHEWRFYLSEFCFFLALPGTKMPLCHNLVEALSCGCIPIIHQEYAKLLAPKLNHSKNALIYSSFESLEVLIAKAMAMSATEINQLSKNSYNYYKDNMTPNAVVKNIQSRNLEKIYLQAEYNSVELIK